MFNAKPILECDDFLIRPISLDDKDTLYAAASDPKIWEQHPSTNRHKPEQFAIWFAGALDNHALVFIDKQNNEIIGSSRYYDISEPEDVAIGYTFLICKHWGGNTNKALKKLMIGYAQEYFNSVWLHIAKDNSRSRRAAEKIGATLSHEGIKSGLAYCWYLAPNNI